MTNWIGRRLDRLETEVQKKTDPGYGPIFKLVDNPRDPENVKRLEEARQFRRDNPNGLIIRHVIVSPPTGKQNWEGVSREERERWLTAYDRYDGLKNTFQEPKAAAAIPCRKETGLKDRPRVPMAPENGENADHEEVQYDLDSLVAEARARFGG